MRLHVLRWRFVDPVVSILLVVELAFEAEKIRDYVSMYNKVSILLVVELAFEAQQDSEQKEELPVSILLVVELAFEDRNRYVSRVTRCGFNPSCSGIGF